MAAPPRGLALGAEGTAAMEGAPMGVWLRGDEKEEQKWKTQRAERPISLHQTFPEMGEESNVSLIIPYAKRSKMVSRYKLEEDPDVASADCSHSDFWDRLVQQQRTCRKSPIRPLVSLGDGSHVAGLSLPETEESPLHQVQTSPSWIDLKWRTPNSGAAWSSHWMEEYHEAPSLLMSGCVAQRPAEAEGETFSWQVISTEQKLPSPKELCRRKKKGAKLQRREKGGVLSVCYHLEELKRRQSSIDELKKAKWGGRLPQLYHEAGPHQGVPQSPFRMPRSALQLYGEEEDPVSQRHSNEQLLYPEWDSGTREQQRIPPESPVLSYTMATLGRYPMAVTCEPEEDLGGFQFQSEE